MPEPEESGGTEPMAGPQGSEDVPSFEEDKAEQGSSEYIVFVDRYGREVRIRPFSAHTPSMSDAEREEMENQFLAEDDDARAAELGRRLAKEYKLRIPDDFTDKDIIEAVEKVMFDPLPDRDAAYDLEEAINRVQMPEDADEATARDVMHRRLEELVELTGGKVVMLHAGQPWEEWWDGLTDAERRAWDLEPGAVTLLTGETDASGEELAAATESAVSHIRGRSAYFEDDKFIPPLLAADIAADLRLTRGPGGGLWYDAGGVYRSGAEALVADIVREVLGTYYRANRLNEVMSWCRTLPETITTDPPDENLLNVANGVLELDTLTLRPVRAEERFTYRIPIAWNPGATCPAITAFVDEVVPADCVALVEEIVGMCLLPTSRYRRAVMLLGPGSNGKSVLLKLIVALLGRENVSSVTLQALSDEHFAKAQLFGKLANVAGDLDSKPVERSGAFKTLTGEDVITADHKYGQPFQFVNYATLVFSANEWPVSHDQTDAYFSRWIAIPFTQRYREDGGELKPGERRADPKLADRLLVPEELEGLLVRAVAGARRLRERGGFAVPQSVRDAIADYRQWADTVMAWIDESVSPSPGSTMTRRDAYRFYRDWCKENGRSAVSTKRFWPRFREVLADRGIEYEEAKIGASSERGLVGLCVAP